jgi:TRAP-type uncharacterized transport system fused permease subunit
MIDGILYVCFLVVAIIGALLIFHGLAMIIYWMRCKRIERYNNSGRRFFDRVK